MVLAKGDEAKLVVKGGHPVDLGSRDLEMAGHFIEGLIGEISYFFLNCLQNA
jgi:hypothetical protein